MDELRAIPLFKDLTDERAKAVAARCLWRTYDTNELIIDYEDESDEVHFILSGKCRVLFRSPTGREIILGELGEGTYFGELAAIDGTRRSANVTAMHRSRLCIMPGRLFMDLATEVPSVSRHMLANLAHLIRGLNARLAEHSFLQTKERLYAELIRQSKPRTGHDGQRIVSPPPFHHDLANRIGCRREVVSRELSALSKAGLTEKSRGGLILCDPGELNRRISKAMER